MSACDLGHHCGERCQSCGERITCMGPDPRPTCGDHPTCVDCEAPTCWACREVADDVAGDAAEQLAITAGREG